MANSGRYLVQNQEKYLGKVDQVTYRSSWEKFYMQYLDKCPMIAQWNSEECVIPYFSEADGRKRRYFMDFWIKTAQGQEFFIEVKPKKETVPPTAPVKQTAAARRRFANEVYTWGVNSSKWRAAMKVAESRGIKFRILTEDGLRKLGMRI